MQPDVITVAISRVDGGLTVMRVVVRSYDADGQIVREVDPTPEYIQRQIDRRGDLWNEANGKKAVSWRIVPNDFLDESTEQEYRNAWKDGGGNKPDHDMAKARNIHRDKLRRARIRPMDALDVEYQKADEADNVTLKRDVAVRKQKLRDVTTHPRIEQAQTIEELRALTLEELM